MLIFCSFAWLFIVRVRLSFYQSSNALLLSFFELAAGDFWYLGGSQDATFWEVQRLVSVHAIELFLLIFSFF
jgi:hypothetical protein